MHSVLPGARVTDACAQGFVRRAGSRGAYALLGAGLADTRERLEAEVATHERMLAELRGCAGCPQALERTAGVLRAAARRLERPCCPQKPCRWCKWDAYCATVGECLDAACEARDRLGDADFDAASHGARLGDLLFEALATELFMATP